MYAAFVRRLDLFGRAGGNYRYKSFDIVLGLAPLLPGLRELVVTNRYRTTSPQWLEHLLKLFLANSLTSISVTGSLPKTVPWLTRSGAGPLTSYVSASGRDLRRLDLYVRIPTNTGWPELVGALGTAVRVVELGLGCDMLDDDVLAVVGAMPRLQTLKVLGHTGSVHGLANLQAPPGSFAALLALQLLDFSVPQMRFLLSVGPLTANLRSVTLVFGHRGGDEDDDDDDEDNELREIESVFTALAAHSPHLVALTCRFLASHLVQIQPGALTPIFQIALREIYFHNARLAGRGDCALFHERWLQATHLSWRYQPATLDDLRAFAGRPPLRMLAVSLKRIADPGHAGPLIDPINPRPDMFRLESDFALHHLNVKGVDNLTL